MKVLAEEPTTRRDRMKVAEMIAKVKEVLAGMAQGHKIAVVVRHGASDPDMPKDTISSKATNEARLLGQRLRKGGIQIEKVVCSPRGRAVATGLAVAEGNANVGESVAPFVTEHGLTDVSNEAPEVVATLQEFVAGSNVDSVEEALLLCPDPDTRKYAWNKAGEYARVISTRSRLNGNGPIMFTTHGGPADIAILRLAHPTASNLTDLGRPVKWMPRGGATILVFDEAGNLVNCQPLF